jgi:serine/threonine protein kinase
MDGNEIKQNKGQSLREKFKFVKLDGAIDLLEKLLALDPTKRITAKDAYLHPFISHGNLMSKENVVTNSATT